MKAKDFLDAVRGYTQQPVTSRTPTQGRPPKMGTVDPAYVNGTNTAKVQFDGETALSGKAYVLIDCTVAAGDRVILIPVGKTLGIIGRIEDGKEIPTAADLNNYTHPGVYIQSNNGRAAAGTNYPAPYAGTLVVRVASGLTFQEYTTYSNASGGMNRWIRGAQGATWKPWRELAIVGDPIVGQPFAMAAGKGVATGATGTVTVTLPSGRFSVPPVVTAQQSAGGSVAISFVTSVLATSFIVRLYLTNGTQYAGQVDWMAVQMTAASASG